MTTHNRYLNRDRIAIVAALAAPLATAAILMPFRAGWSNTNVALLLVVVIVGVAAIGNRVAGALAAVWAAVTITDTDYLAQIHQTAGSCSRPGPAPDRRCRHAWSPLHWPIRPAARSVPAGPRRARPYLATGHAWQWPS